MKILAIETSCDETSIALIEKVGGGKYKVYAHETISQINLHREWGGVYPTLSRREHEKNLIPLLHKVLLEGNLLEEKYEVDTEKSEKEITKKLGENIILLERYNDLKQNIFNFFTKYKTTEDLDLKNFCIAVTNGPGLPPALWVGVNFAKVLSILFGKENNIPIYPINHMEGHIIGAISKTENNIVEIFKIEYPVINLLISGGHTELVLSDKNMSYKKIGETQDDAAGECFDKVARMLNLPYPGGPEIRKLVEKGREIFASQKSPSETIFKFPRPMLHSSDLHFSFSGLKTHILYLTQKLQQENNFKEEIKIQIASEFEETIKDVLVLKSRKAIEQYRAKTLVVGGGVASNLYLRQNLEKMANGLNIKIFISDKTLSTDNALMIALCAANQIENNILPTKEFIAIGSKNYNVW